MKWFWKVVTVIKGKQILKIFLNIIYMKGRDTERHLQSIGSPPIHWFTPQCPHWPSSAFSRCFST